MSDPCRPKFWDYEKAAWDLYAAHALTAQLPAYLPNDKGDLERRVENAANWADAMLAERRRRMETP